MDSNWFEIVRLIFMALCVLVFRIIFPWIQLKVADLCITKSVLAARQLYWSETGAFQKEKALESIHDLFDLLHLPFTDDQIDTLIESAVKEMNMRKHEVTDGKL